MKKCYKHCSRNVYEQIVFLKQVDSVKEYVQEYEKAIAKLSAMPKEQHLGYFMNGLNDDIK